MIPFLNFKLLSAGLGIAFVIAIALWQWERASFADYRAIQAEKIVNDMQVATEDNNRRNRTKTELINEANKNKIPIASPAINLDRLRNEAFVASPIKPVGADSADGAIPDSCPERTRGVDSETIELIENYLNESAIALQQCYNMIQEFKAQEKYYSDDLP